MRIHHSRVIHFATRRAYDYAFNREEWQGLSVLDPVWDDLVTLRNIRWGMGQTMYRYGSGFPDITLKNRDLETINKWVESGEFTNMSARKAFVHSENEEIDFKGVAGHELNPMNYYLPIMENISCASGIPLAILRGVQAGALTGSEVNQQEYYGLISDEQSAYEDGIRELINTILKVGLPESQIQDYELKWLSGIELPEQQRTEIALAEAQTWEIKGQWMTRNEIRKAIDPDLKPLTPEQGGDEIMGKSSLPPFQEGEKFRVEPHTDGTSTVTRVKRSRRR
jgi:hypothetical protein